VGASVLRRTQGGKERDRRWKAGTFNLEGDNVAWVASREGFRIREAVNRASVGAHDLVARKKSGPFGRTPRNYRLHGHVESQRLVG